jgi:hypothetical protein
MPANNHESRARTGNNIWKIFIKIEILSKNLPKAAIRQAEYFAVIAEERPGRLDGRLITRCLCLRFIRHVKRQQAR